MVVEQAITSVARSAKKSDALSVSRMLLDLQSMRGDLQTISLDTSVLMSSRRAGLWIPQTVNEAGWVRSSKHGEAGSKAGVP